MMGNIVDCKQCSGKYQTCRWQLCLMYCILLISLYYQFVLAQACPELFFIYAYRIFFSLTMLYLVWNTHIINAFNLICIERNNRRPLSWFKFAFYTYLIVIVFFTDVFYNRLICLGQDRDYYNISISCYTYIAFRLVSRMCCHQTCACSNKGGVVLWEHLVVLSLW